MRGLIYIFILLVAYAFVFLVGTPLSAACMRLIHIGGPTAYFSTAKVPHRFSMSEAATAGSRTSLRLRPHTTVAAACLRELYACFLCLRLRASHVPARASRAKACVLTPARRFACRRLRAVRTGNHRGAPLCGGDAHPQSCLKKRLHALRKPRRVGIS